MRRPLLLCWLLALNPALLHADVATHHDLSVRLDPRNGSFTCTDRISRSAAHGESFALDEGILVDRLLVDGKPVTVHADAGAWQIPVTETGARIEVEYHGQVESDASTLALIAATGWYPTFEDEPVTYELEVTVPTGFLAVSPGEIISESETEVGYRARFKSDISGEGISLFIGPYEIKERIHGRLRLRTYLHAEVADLADLYLTKTAEYIDLYEKQIGAYPYSAFYVVSAVTQVGLGFPGLTYMGTQVLRLPFIPDTSLGHEVLHTWWGNGVFIDSSQGNWAEGLTTFMADYAYAERKGEKEALEMRMRWLREYAELPAEKERPLSSFRSRQHAASQTVGYHKAAMVFLMLREKIGHDVFAAGIRRFWDTRRFQPATWGDLRNAFEAAADARLDEFFSQWLDRAGAPGLRVESAGWRQRGGAYEVVATLTQKAPVYRLDVPLEITTENETRAHRVVFDAAQRQFTFRAAEAPRQLRVDPRFELFRRLDPSEFPPIFRNVAFAARPTAMIATNDREARDAARAVATAFFEQAPAFSEASKPLPDTPVLMVGTSNEIAALLARHELPATPKLAEGSARVWAGRRPDERPYVVVEGDDAEALRLIAGPLPHYGSQSFIVFDGRRAVERGVWPVAGSSMHVALHDLP